MSTFVNNDVSSGAIVYASDHNTQGALIGAVINGGIDNTNISSSAAIDGSKLANSSVTSTKISFGGSGAGVWWEEIGRVTLSVAGDTLSIPTLSPRKYLKIIFSCLNSGTISCALRFNNDSASTYGWRKSVNGAAEVTAAPAAQMSVDNGGVAYPQYGELTVNNLSAQEKVLYGHLYPQAASGSSTAPIRIEFAGKWANTSAQITRVDLINLDSGDYAIGSELIVLGHD